jgi:hypothetical protein
VTDVALSNPADTTRRPHLTRRTKGKVMRRLTLALVAVFALLAPSASAEQFGRMFPKLPALQFSAQQAADLVATEQNPTPDPAGVDRGTPDDSTTLPSEFTYLGQFADHDLDFDPTGQPSSPTNPATITNGRTFQFDLDSVFGNGPTGSPQLYAADHAHLLVQQPNSNGVLDYSRNPDGTANIAEGRNDENKILSQIGTALIVFYNQFVDQGLGFQQARALTVDYWQTIVLDDLLPAYVGQATINRYLQAGRVTTPDFPHNRFTPIEFSVGAYRFGHSIVRELYHVNDDLCNGGDIDHNLPIFSLAAFQTGDLSGGAPLLGPLACPAPSAPVDPRVAGDAILWKYFVPALNANPADPGINFARNTQVTVSPALFNLPAFVIPGCADATSPVCNGSGNLLSRDYARGEEYGLPSGQSIARVLGCAVINARTINPTSDTVFNQGTPLLYYVLAEGQKAGKTLGCVGKRIVAETFLRVLADDATSILHDGFKPDPKLIVIDPKRKQFTFGDLLVDAGVAPRSS